MTLSRDRVSGIQQKTEVALHVSNTPGVLARLLGCLASRTDAVDGWRFYSDHRQATILLVTMREDTVRQALRSGGFDCEASPVVVLEQEHRGGVSAVRLSAELRASGIRILDAYRCGSLRNGALLVLKTTDNAGATVVLEMMNLLETQSLPIPSDLGIDEVDTAHVGAP